MKQQNILAIKNLHTGVKGREILSGISFTVKSGEIHVIMGPNGSGKSTLAYGLMGHPSYEVQHKDAGVMINGKNILSLQTPDRAKAGLFLALQSPIAIPGVSVINLLRSSYQELHAARKAADSKVQNPLLARRWKAADISLMDFMKVLSSYAKELRIDESFLSRGIHDGFSGGEKKKIEMLQALVLSPKFAIFDEIDNGLDVDALKLVARGISLLSEKGTGVIIITHYQRILKYMKPDVVHILVKGKLVKSGKASLAREIEEEGYEKYL